jgi:hypothetical protein
MGFLLFMLGILRILVTCDPPAYFAQNKTRTRESSGAGWLDRFALLLNYHSALRPKTLTSVRVIIRPRVVVVMRVVLLVVWVLVISVLVLQRGGDPFITSGPCDCQQILLGTPVTRA